MNNVQLLGNIATEIKVEEKKTKKGDKFLTAWTVLAVNAGPDKTNFIPVSFTGNICDTLEKFCAVGSRIAIDGYIDTWEEEDRKGNKTSHVQVRATKFHFCEKAHK